MDKKLQRKLFRRLLLLQAAWNYEKMQNIGFAYVMQPALEKLYCGDELKKAVKRHLESFNTQPYMASFIAGVTVRLEEERAALKNEDKKAELTAKINSTKHVMSTATAAIGDPYFWGTLKPFALVLLLWVCQFFGYWQWNVPVSDVSIELSWVLISAVLFSALLYNLIVVDIRWSGIAKGYRNSRKSMFGLDYYNWQRIIRAVKTTGFALVCMVVLGAFYSLSSYIETLGCRIYVIPLILGLIFFLKRVTIMKIYLSVTAAGFIYFLLGGRL